MRVLIERLRGERIERMAFGDLYLTDIRAYREQQLQGTGIAPLFPLWNEPTAALARSMIAGGLKAVLTCVDPKQLAPEFCGREFNAALLDALPAGVDRCGENGEFHSFACAGPMFRAPVAVEIGETVERDGFVFTDLCTVQRRPPPWGGLR
jgi:diphthamide synthase (EF-2-diphthine--ammonia ligase)